MMPVVEVLAKAPAPLFFGREGKKVSFFLSLSLSLLSLLLSLSRNVKILSSGFEADDPAEQKVDPCA